MAIVPTGAIYKSLVFDGESSRDYGIYITGQAVYNAPERDVEMINIPGRNGSFALDKGRFQNIEVTYPAGIFADNEADFAQGISDFRNFLCSRNGYVRLTDDYNPDEYRMAVYKSGLDVSPAQLKAGEFQIVFDCKPQRYLTSGEEPVTIGEWHETETASGSIASFEAEAGDAVKSLVADIEPIQDLNGYDKPWSGGAGKNKLEITATTQTVNGITFTVNSDGTIKANGTATSTVIKSIGTVTVTGSFILNGCPSGGGTETFRLDARNGNSILAMDSGNGSSTYTATDTQTVHIRIGSGVTVNNLVFKPMIRLSSVSDATYEPYSNICPISGWDSVVVSRCGKNLLSIPSVSLVKPATRTASINIDEIPAGTYKFTCNYSGTANNVSLVFRKQAGVTADQVQINPNGVERSVTFTVPMKNIYVFIASSETDGVTADITNMMIRLASDADATYEPYQSNTYTTSLNGTRYGGTLDVASGVLTVDRAMVDLGDFTWSSFHSPTTDYFYSNALSDYKYIDSDTINYLCSAYESISGNQQRTNGTLRIASTKSITIQDLNYASASAFKTAVTGQTLCYEITNPTTVQLTAQEVELLVGLNQVWANSGDVTVEYGTRPSAVYNPTLFESSPMLEVKGYGNIVIGGEEIAVAQGEAYGEILICSKLGREQTLDTSLLASGDDIYPKDSPNSQVTLELRNSYDTLASISLVDAINCTTEVTNRASNGAVLNVYPTVEFAYGTASSVTASATCSIRIRSSRGTSASYTATMSVTIAYDGDNTLTMTTNNSFSIPNTRITSGGQMRSWYGNSSVTILGNPIYIDLDIGEAWNEDTGTPVSINNAVTLGAELPVLAVGETEITFDNTITDLKVVPRWWKI